MLQDMDRQAMQGERQLVGVIRHGWGMAGLPSQMVPVVQDHSATWHSCALSWVCVLVLPTAGLGTLSLTKEIKVLMEGHDGD